MMHLLLKKMSAVAGPVPVLKGKNGMTYYCVDALLDNCRHGNPMQTGKRKSVSTFLRKHGLLITGIAMDNDVKPNDLHKHLENGKYKGWWVSHQLLFPFLCWLDQRFVYEANRFFCKTVEPLPNARPHYTIPDLASDMLHHGEQVNREDIVTFLMEEDLIHFHHKKKCYVPAKDARTGQLLKLIETDNNGHELVFTPQGAEFVRMAFKTIQEDVQ